MELFFNDVLISARFSDFSFQNPVELRLNEDGDIIGSAELSIKKDKIYANIVIQKHVDYLLLYPRIAVDVNTKQIGYVFLSNLLGIDPEVKTLKEQLQQPQKK